MSDPEAAVVGGGIVGASVAYHLARAGVDVTLYDREDEGRATDAGAGIVSPATSSRTESPAWFDLGAAAADYYPDLAAALSAAGHDHGYARPGLLHVALDPDDRAAFDRGRRRTLRRAAEVGVPDPSAVRELPPGDARDLFPPLGDVDRAVLVGDAARVDGRRFAGALRAAARDAGLELRRESVTGIRVENGRVRGVHTAAGGRRASAIVVAGGAWSPAFAGDLGIDVPVEPQRGQISHVDAGAAGFDRPVADWPILTVLGHQYMVPWPDGRVACGATRETGSGYAPHVTLGGLREVASEALAAAPGLADARHVETRAGLRPVSADGLPLLGPVPGVEGAYLATGHGATGLQLGPYTGRLVADLVRGAPPGPDAGPTPDLDPFRPDRFGRAAAR